MTVSNYVLIERLENGTARAEDQSVSYWMMLARGVESGDVPTSFGKEEIIKRIQKLLVDAGLMTSAEFNFILTWDSV